MTLHRALVCLSVLGMFACVRSDAAPKARRPAPTTEPVAAVVLHLQGTTTVRPAGGAPFAAAVDHDLVRSDRLEPAEGAFAIVGLQNGHVVRVDDVGALAVKDILLLDAPATTRPVEEQLAILLDPGEHGAGLGQVAERAAAWRQMRRAGETSRGRKASAPANEAAKAEEVEAAAVEDVSGGRADDADADVVGSQEGTLPPPPSPEPAADEPYGAKPPAEPAKKKPAKPKQAKTKPAKPEPPPPSSAPQTPAAPLPPPEPGVIVKAGPSIAAATTVTPTPSLGGGVGACLAQTARDVRLDPAAVTLWLEVKGGVIRRVRFAGALPVSACAVTLRGRSVGVPDGWLVVGRAP